METTANAAGVQKPTLGRTAVVTIVMGAIILVALFLCLRSGTETAASMFSTAAWALVVLAGGKAAQSAVEGIATGTGLKGIGRALMTDAKPGAPDSTKVTETVEQTITKAP